MIVQLVPPGSGGVSDHALRLAQQWSAAGIANTCLPFGLADQLDRPLAGRVPEGSSLLIHFSGYGYHPRGLCGWLPDAVQELQRARGGRVCVVTRFHELYASGPPWTSAFWLAAAQWRIAARLCGLSAAVVASSRHHAAWLRSRGARSVLAMPVFSNVTEPGCPVPAQDRRPALVVFGSPSTRQRALLQLPRWAPMLREQGIAELIEVGSGPGTALPRLALGHRFAGHLDDLALQRLLGETSHALIDYPSIHLAKSSVFAAYAAHGCVVLNTSRPGPDADGLVDGVQLATLARSPVPVKWDVRQAMAQANRRWYGDHRLSAQAQALAALCGATASS